MIGHSNVMHKRVLNWRFIDDRILKHNVETRNRGLIDECIHKRNVETCLKWVFADDRYSNVM